MRTREPPMLASERAVIVRSRRTGPLILAGVKSQFRKVDSQEAEL